VLWKISILKIYFRCLPMKQIKRRVQIIDIHDLPPPPPQKKRNRRQKKSQSRKTTLSPEPELSPVQYNDFYLPVETQLRMEKQVMYANYEVFCKECDQLSLQWYHMAHLRNYLSDPWYYCEQYRINIERPQLVRALFSQKTYEFDISMFQCFPESNRFYNVVKKYM
jgi:hypothetical protein